MNGSGEFQLQRSDPRTLRPSAATGNASARTSDERCSDTTTASVVDRPPFPGVTLAFEGPLPHPTILDAYTRVPGAAELVLEMARDEQRHRHAMELRQRAFDEMALDVEAGDMAEEWALWRRGQVVGACVVAFIALVGTVGTVLLATIGASPWVTGVSSLIPVGSVVAIVRTWMLDGKSKRERERRGALSAVTPGAKSRSVDRPADVTADATATPAPRP